MRIELLHNLFFEQDNIDVAYGYFYALINISDVDAYILYRTAHLIDSLEKVKPSKTLIEQHLDLCWCLLAGHRLFGQHAKNILKLQIELQRFHLVIDYL